jgi:hypothetical protein
MCLADYKRPRSQLMTGEICKVGKRIRIDAGICPAGKLPNFSIKSGPVTDEQMSKKSQEMDKNITLSDAAATHATMEHSAGSWSR